MVIVVQVLLSALILLVGLWLWGLAMSPREHRRLLGDRAGLMRVLMLPDSQSFLNEPLSLEAAATDSLPFAPLLSALAEAHRKTFWETCGIAVLLAAALLLVSCLFGLVYLGINVGLLLVAGVVAVLGPRSDGESVLPFARVFLRWHEVNPAGCQSFCTEERPDYKTLHEVLLKLPPAPDPNRGSRSEAAAPPIQPGAEVFYTRANAYLQAGDLPKAIADCTQAIRLRPDHAEAHYCRGSAYLATGECNKAMADFVDAIRLKPDFAEAYYLRACTYLQIGKADTAYGELQSALADCSVAIRLNANYVEAYCRRGDLYLQLNEVYKALADYSRAMRLNPAYAEPYYRRGLEFQEKRPH